MEIDVTQFFRTAEASDFSASQMELGPNAGRITWSNAMREASDAPMLTTPEQLDALRDHAREYGAWDDAQIDAWTDDECNAFLVQEVAAAIRESDLDTCDPDWKAYEADCDAGRASGRMGPGSDGRIWFYLGT